MASATAPKLLFDQHLSDLNEHARQANVQIEMRQLDAGAPRARIAVMGTPTCTVFRGEYDRSYHQEGYTPANILSIGIPDSNVGEFRWCNKRASGDQITNLSLDSGFDGVCGAGFAGFVISLHHDLLHETLESLELNIDLRHLLSGHEVLPHSEIFARELRFHVLAAFGSAQFSYLSETTEFFNFSAAALVLKFLAKNRAQPRTPPIGLRGHTARTAVQYLEDADDLPVTVSELCSKVGVSAPTLYRSFQEQFGISPKQYIQVRRLCGVRQQLLLGDETVGIADTANKWGFWHMGQFAADYRRHFGQLPSETLARAQ